ncbi:MAG: hypothetical protein WCX69_00090 [Candidatus Paceibacterota bacterium]
MVKAIVLKLAKIKYGGKSIGDDIRVEIEAMGQIATIDKKIKINTGAEINREAARFLIDQKSFKTGVKITVIEKDLLFNDVGIVEKNIKIDVEQGKPQEFSFEIQVRENRSVLLNKFWGKAVAVFEVILAVEVFEMAQYVPDNDDNKGWLNIILESDKTFVSIPAYTKIKTEKIEKKREYFIPLEGAYRGKLATVKLTDDGTSQFISGIVHKPMAHAQYSISQKILSLGDKKYKAADHPDSPWKKGLYDIEIPDYPHQGGARYQKDAPRAKTWFRVGHSGARYLHTGMQSLGCLTVVEVSRWAEIYNALIKARKGDSASVGVLEVID